MSNHRRYYAVRIGREGPRIYDNESEVSCPHFEAPSREPALKPLLVRSCSGYHFLQLFSASAILNCVV